MSPGPIISPVVRGDVSLEESCPDRESSLNSLKVMFIDENQSEVRIV